MANPAKVVLIANERLSVIELDHEVVEQGEEFTVTAITGKKIVDAGLATYKTEGAAPAATVSVKE